MELYTIYRPITATPFRSSDNYMEFEPCDVLKPYIRCFWGTKSIVSQKESDAVTKEIVTPDTCMDIIFTADYTNNKLESRFRGIDDRSFSTANTNKENKIFSSFAIRFYAWGAAAFAEESMRDTRNAFLNAEYHFSKLKKEIEKLLFNAADIYHLIPMAEKILLNCLHEKHNNQTVLQAVYEILAGRGNISMTDLKHQVLVSSRQLERLFNEYIGISPKGLSSIVRYQYLWSDLIYNKDFHPLDAVYKYGYSDQAHLCHDFKKYHSMSMADARKYAMQDVSNISL